MPAEQPEPGLTDSQVLRLDVERLAAKLAKMTGEVQQTAGDLAELLTRLQERGKPVKAE